MFSSEHRQSSWLPCLYLLSADFTPLLPTCTLILQNNVLWNGEKNILISYLFKIFNKTNIIDGPNTYNNLTVTSVFANFRHSIRQQGLYSTCPLGFQPHPHLLSCIGCLLKQELNLKYVSSLLKLWSLTSHPILGNFCLFPPMNPPLGLRSAGDPYHLHEPTAIGERAFANRSFPYIAPCLYNKLPITIKLIDSLNTFKSHLTAFLFSCAYGQSGLTVQENYAL